MVCLYLTCGAAKWCAAFVRSDASLRTAGAGRALFLLPHFNPCKIPMGLKLKLLQEPESICMNSFCPGMVEDNYLGAIKSCFCSSYSLIPGKFWSRSRPPCTQSLSCTSLLFTQKQLQNKVFLKPVKSKILSHLSSRHEDRLRSY